MISQSVLAALQNLHCEDCQLAKKNEIQHPQSSKTRRSNIPFQIVSIVYVDMCYNPYYSEIKINKKSSVVETPTRPRGRELGILTPKVEHPER